MDIITISTIILVVSLAEATLPLISMLNTCKRNRICINHITHILISDILSYILTNIWRHPAHFTPFSGRNLQLHSILRTVLLHNIIL